MTPEQVTALLTTLERIAVALEAPRYLDGSRWVDRDGEQRLGLTLSVLPEEP